MGPSSKLLPLCLALRQVPEVQELAPHHHEVAPGQSPPHERARAVLDPEGEVPVLREVHQGEDAHHRRCC